MIDLIRDLLDRPLDRRHAQAIVALASCLTIAFAALVALGVLDHPSETGGSARRLHLQPTAPPIAAGGVDRRRSRDAREATAGQDPQDRAGTSAYRRARRTVRDHRALQHLPFRRGGLEIVLAGSDQGRAVIRVVAPTAADARRGWRRFLHRFQDDGAAYEPRFLSRSRSLTAGRSADAGPDAGGAAGPDGSAKARRRRDRHHKRCRAAGDLLTSKPHPKASH